MSFARAALRLAAVEALKAAPAMAALVGGRVFDSRLGDFDASEAVPVIRVTTENDSGDAYSANNGGPPFDRRCELVLELAVRVEARDEAGDPIFVIPVVDAEGERVLDAMESLAIRALFVSTAAWPMLIADKVARRGPINIESDRFGTDETGQKYLIRVVKMTIPLFAEVWEPGTGAYAALPAPLRDVCAAAPDGSDCKGACDVLVNDLAAVLAPISAVNAAEWQGTDITLGVMNTLDPTQTRQQAEDAGTVVKISTEVTNT